MTRSIHISFTLLLAAALLAGCAGSKEAAAPHPLAGGWAYSIDTPQGVFSGTLTFAEAEDLLTGFIAGEASSDPAQGAPLEKLNFEENVVTFSYDSGEYGVMNVTLTLEGNSLNGDMDVLDYGATVPFVSSRKTE